MEALSVLGVIVIFILCAGFSFLLIAGVYKIYCWSFDYKFSWKGVIGVYIMLITLKSVLRD